MQCCKEFGKIKWLYTTANLNNNFILLIMLFNFRTYIYVEPSLESFFHFPISLSVVAVWCVKVGSRTHRHSLALLMIFLARPLSIIQSINHDQASHSPLSPWLSPIFSKF